MPGIGPLQACLEEAQPLLLKDRPWAQVVDPAQAAVLSLARMVRQLPAVEILRHPRLGDFRIMDLSPGFFVDLIRPLALQASGVNALK
eukprot:2030930-Pyramimonas_sp.AAC.1